MFTGIIQELGVVESLRHQRGGMRIAVKRRTRGRIGIGESIAVDGVCLTVSSVRNGEFQADLSPETLARTSLGKLEPGTRLNLERPLRLADPLGGHLVQGHVDAVGRLVSLRRRGDFVSCRWSFPAEFAELVVPKGSIAVNGVSLTVVKPDDSSFAAELIPETLQRTNLGALHPGDPVNLEFDLIAKLVRHLLQPYQRKLETR